MGAVLLQNHESDCWNFKHVTFVQSPKVLKRDTSSIRIRACDEGQLVAILPSQLENTNDRASHGRQGLRTRATSTSQMLMKAIRLER